MGTDIRREIYKGLGEASSIAPGFTRRAFQMLPNSANMPAGTVLPFS